MRFAVDNLEINNGFSDSMFWSFYSFELEETESIYQTMKLCFLMSLLILQHAILAKFPDKNIRECLTSLANTLKSDNKLYQIVAVYDDSGRNSFWQEELSRAVFAIVPTMIIRLDSSMPQNHPVLNLPEIEILRPSTLFVVHSVNATFVEKTFAILSEKMWPVHDQKFLLIYNDLEEGKAILEYAWTQQFVDVTILRGIVDVADDKYRFFVGTSPNRAASLLHFDPMANNSYNEFECSSGSVWFPEKMKNWRNYPLRVDLLNNPPFTKVKRNSSGHVVEKSGSSVNNLDFLVQALKFKPEIVPRHEEDRPE